MPENAAAQRAHATAVPGAEPNAIELGGLTPESPELSVTEQPLPQWPSPVFTMPAHPEEYFPVRHSDWLRLRQQIEARKQPATWVSQVGWAAVGVAATAFVGLFPWMAVSSEQTKNDYAWITPLLAAAGVVMVIIAILCLALSRFFRGVERRSTKTICEDMDAIYEPYRKADPRPRVPPSDPYT